MAQFGPDMESNTTYFVNDCQYKKKNNKRKNEFPNYLKDLKITYAI